MSAKITTVREPNAKELILRASECEEHDYILEAVALYDDAVLEQLRLIRLETNPERVRSYRKMLRDYELHLDEMKLQVQQHMVTSKMIEKISIAEGSRGHSYAKMFGPYLNDDVREVHIYEPYLTERDHFTNLMNLLELVVKSCRNLSYVRVFTRFDTNMPHNQMKILKNISEELSKGYITFNFKFDDTLRECKIVLSNGFIIKIGRGLHYFKNCATTHSLGVCDFDFRKCLKTEIAIWRTAPFSKKYGSFTK